MKNLLSLMILVGLLAGMGIIGRDTALAQDGCSGLVPSRLSGASTARVIFNGDGIGVVFRDNPGKEQSGSDIIRALPEGEVLSIINGPICVDAAVWWNVELSTGERGWVAEGDVTDYFIEPFIVSIYTFERDTTNSRLLNRWRVDIDGNIRARDSFTVPGGDPSPASQLWQEPDLLAANAALADRRFNCPNALAGTLWENISDAGQIIVPEGEFEFYPSPDGGKIFLVRHRVVLMPSCNPGTGQYFGVSTVHLLSKDGIQNLFPYGQNSGARSKDACLSPDVSNQVWRTYLSEVRWSPDSDTVAFTARYLDSDEGDRPCAFYFIFMVDVFSGNVVAIAEGRHVGWGEGGTRLYYFSEVTDNGYNVTDERFNQLSNGETTRISFPSGTIPLPAVFDSIGIYLPWSSDGRRVLMCTGPINCPSTFSFQILDRQPTTANAVPSVFAIFEVKDVQFVAGDTRLLWLTQSGEAYLQAVQGIDEGNFEAVPLGNVDAGIDSFSVMPSGVHVLLRLSNGEYALLNTVSRAVTPLGILTDRDAPAEEVEPTITPEESGESTEATEEPADNAG